MKVSRFNVGAGHLEVCANCRSVTGKRLRIEMRQGHKIARVEEVAYHTGYIDGEHLPFLAKHLANGEYA